MMKFFIGYVSMSGNTEDIANALKESLLLTGCEVEMECLDKIEGNIVLPYDCIFIGTYTWGDGDLPYEAEGFFDELDRLDLSGKHVACFGSGDYAYPKFCGAVDVFAEKLEEKGCLVFDQRLKVEFAPETDEQVIECQQFAQSVFEWVVRTKESELV